MSAGAAPCGDDMLGYERSRTRFVLGAGLTLDEAYRLAHLPLVAPDHPRVIARKDGAPYEMGRRAPVVSLVLHVAWEDLAASPAFKALEAELSAAPFARKIAWAASEARRDRLHATICGSMTPGREAPALTEAQRAALEGLEGVDVELRGAFSGNVNLGRLYLRAYPERRGDENLFAAIQRVFGRAPGDLYVVGMWNLADDLDARETEALAAIIDAWWRRPLLRLRAERLRFLWSCDDLALDGGFAGDVALTRRRTPLNPATCA
jgi:hypothetical protein